MFEAWQTFYLIVGTAGAALVGVMFIVTTLTAEMEYDRFNRGTAIYVTPSVAHSPRCSPSARWCRSRRWTWR